MWEVDRRGGNTMVHGNQKPLALVNRALKNSSKHGDIVLDLFLGSGSTMIACQKTKRICYGMELDPRHVDTEILRWEALTGEKAKKIS